MKTLTCSHEEFTQLVNDDVGFCVLCGELDYSGVEPDARKYTCECCDECGVYGIEELLIMDKVKITD